MAAMLIKLRRKAASVPDALRARLEEAQAPAMLIDADYRIVAANRAYRARYGEGRVVGQPCYAVSHRYDSPCDENGESCPLRAALATGRLERVFHVHHGPEGPHHVDVEMTPLVEQDRSFLLEVLRDVDEASAVASGEFIGRAPAFVHALSLLHRAAPSDVPVLLLGESGTGKELAARALHRASGRREGALVPVECSGLADTLFESELFGHEQGAFTGAHKTRRGLVDAARGGTLFLDEIGDVPLAQQVKLLRLLESGTYRRVGGTDVLRAEFRLVCATHRDLESMVRDGLFREDLYFRISAFPVRLPSLAERKEDIPLLAEAFVASRPAGKRLRLHPDAVALLVERDYPGNVRELRNLIERAALLADGGVLLPTHFPPLPGALRSRTDGDVTREGAFVLEEVAPLADVEARYLVWASERVAGNRTELARALDVGERTLYRKLDAARRAAAAPGQRTTCTSRSVARRRPVPPG
jgi:two-component system, NtrC family, response regulator HydG